MVGARGGVPLQSGHDRSGWHFDPRCTPQPCQHAFCASWPEYRSEAIEGSTQAEAVTLYDWWPAEAF